MLFLFMRLPYSPGSFRDLRFRDWFINRTEDFMQSLIHQRSSIKSLRSSSYVVYLSPRTNRTALSFTFSSFSAEPLLQK